MTILKRDDIQPLCPSVVIQRYRVRLSRQGEAILLSHLQQIDSIRKALKMSGWPLSYTKQKKPRVRVSFGPAISVGYASDAEYFDVDLASRIKIDDAKIGIEKGLSAGYTLLGLKTIPIFFPSLEHSLNMTFYEILSPLLRGSEEKWKYFWDSPKFPVVKKKEDREEIIDARRCVRAWDLTGDALKMELRFGPGRTLKPERIIQAVLGLDDSQILIGEPNPLFQIKRTRLTLEKADGQLIDP